ncbi:MAG: hypothetical protein CMM76_17555 [Rhodospirillaceae bacterium]|nr:hypothetical protein [Rhodospirillaceae bacterium]MBE91237.1 hypothetical protein [Rhodospirillaceae bacterium]
MYTPENKGFYMKAKTIVMENQPDKLVIVRTDENDTEYQIEVPEALEHVADSIQALPEPLSAIVDNIIIQAFHAGAEFVEVSTGNFEEMDRTEDQTAAVESVQEILLDVSIAKIQAEHTAASLAHTLSPLAKVLTNAIRVKR